MTDDDILTAILQRDLASFIEHCFVTLEPGTAYQHNVSVI
jgi:hypothetical protein